MGKQDALLDSGGSAAVKLSLIHIDVYKRQLYELCQNHEVKWIKVKGHSDDPLNNRCDMLAVAAAAAYKKQKLSSAPEETEKTEVRDRE